MRQDTNTMHFWSPALNQKQIMIELKYCLGISVLFDLNWAIFLIASNDFVPPLGVFRDMMLRTVQSISVPPSDHANSQSLSFCENWGSRPTWTFSLDKIAT